MSSMRRFAIVVVAVVGALPAKLAAQPAENAESANAPTVVVEAGTPVPVPLEAVAERLRIELPSVPVQVGPLAGGPATSSAATVTLALSAEGQLRIVYRDEHGRVASRIVADTHDPQAVAAAVAMIIANLHQSQVGAALASIGGPPVAPAPPPAPPPAPAVVAPATRAPIAVRAQAAITSPSAVTFGFSLSPTLDWIGEMTVPGFETMVDLSIGSKLRVELSFAYGLPTTGVTQTWVDEVGEVGWDVDYAQASIQARLRRLFPLNDHLSLGVAAGLGLVITSLTYIYPSALPDGWSASPGPYTDLDRSDLDALGSLAGSLDVRLVGRTLYWTTRLEAAYTTADQTIYRPIAPAFLVRAGTGLRLAI